MARPKQRASIRDVAARAGVSHQTVSRVLNQPELVRPDTAARVQQAIDDLGFRPSKAARSLATHDSMVIGVISVQAGLFGPSHTTLAIDEGARRRGYATATVTVRDDSPANLGEAREHLLGLGVDGVVLIAWSEPVLALALRFASELPTCAVAEGDVPEGLARVRGDHRGGAAQAVRALRESGRRCIAHLAGPGDWLEARARRQGWADEAGALAGPVIETGWEPEGGLWGVDEVLAKAPGVDAIFAANDHLAAGALRRLTELGKRVPDDIALVGYDDVELRPLSPRPVGVGPAAVRRGRLGGDRPALRADGRRGPRLAHLAIAVRLARVGGMTL